MNPEKLFSERFSELVNSNKYTLEEIGFKIGIKSKGTISKFMSGEIKNVKRSHVVNIANLFGVSPAWLAGLSDEKFSTSKHQILPILGTVKAGYNWLAEENVVDHITVKEHIPNINEYFALKVTGDSMLPLLSEGDLIIVHDQDDVESGQTAVILINGDEATVKKIIKTSEGIELHAMNPYYPIKKFSFEDMKKISVKIIGRVKEAKIKGAFK